MSAMNSMKSVLVVEDDRDLRTLWSLMLEAEGYTVFKADDGQVGLDTLGAHVGEIGVVITDLGLPKIGGVDLIARVRAIDPAVKIIGTSGYGTANIRDMVIAAGANAFFPKPFSMPEVINKMKSLDK